MFDSGYMCYFDFLLTFDLIVLLLCMRLLGFGFD